MSNTAVAEEPPHEKRKKTSPSSSSSSPLSSLPDEMVLNCLARVSKSDKAALSAVSKSYRSLMASPELYNTRSLLGYTENCVYVCLVTPPNPTPHWFILHKGKNANRLLSPIPSFPSHPTEGSSVVAFDGGIYVIGGLVEEKLSSDVLILDCWTHTWRKLPSMGEARSSFAAGVVDGKIYVFGGCKDPDSSKWAEVFDTKTQTWDSFSPVPEDRMMRDQYIHNSWVLRKEKVYAVDGMDRIYYYSPSEGKWERGIQLPIGGNRRDFRVVDENLILCIDCIGNICWSEIDQLTDAMVYWRRVKGLTSLKKSISSSRLVQFDKRLEAIWDSYKINNGIDGENTNLIDLLPGARLCSNNSSSGNNSIMLFWDVIEMDRLEIWCAEISLERRQGPKIWGNIEWSNAVMTVDPFLHRYKVLHSVSLTL